MNKRSVVQRLAVSLVTTLGLLFLFFAMTRSVASKEPPSDPLPEQPPEGCYDVVTAGTGMWNGSGRITVEVPGPVFDAYLWWAGAFEAGGDELIVSNTLITRTIHVTSLVSLVDPPWFLWRANLGSEGYGLVHEGANILRIEGWEGDEDSQRNGATLAVIYETSGTACLKPVELQLHEYLDWIYGGQGQIFSDLQIYPIVPAPFSRTLTATISFAGTDAHPIQPNGCRESYLLFASGADDPPTQPLGHDYRIAANPLWQATSPITCPTAYTLPATSLSGGYVDDEWSVFSVEVRVPSNHEWVAFQLESPPFETCPLPGCGESGAWVGNVLEIQLPQPDVAVSTTDGLTTPQPGDTLIYTISYANNGVRPASDVRIVDTLPGHSRYVGCSTVVGTCSQRNGKVDFNLGTLNSNTRGTAQVTVELDRIFPVGDTTIVNHVTINTSTPGDEDPTNNEHQDTDIVTANVNVAIDKSGPLETEPGAEVIYTMDWHVTGNAWAESTTITDTVPANTDFLGCGPAPCSESNRVVIWRLGTITPNASGTVTLAVQVVPLPSSPSITNTAHIFEASGNNDEDSVTTIIRSHQLHIAKAAGPNPVFVTQSIAYTIPWAVTGNEPAPDVVITDAIPDGTRFESVTDDCEYELWSDRVTCDLGTKNPPANGSVGLKVTVLAAQSITNRAYICEHNPGPLCLPPAVKSHLPGLIGGQVWLDPTSGGPPPGQSGTPTVTVRLRDAGPGATCEPTDRELNVTTIDIPDTYSFSPLQTDPFTYCVDADDILPKWCLVPTTAPTTTIPLTPGGTSLGNDFGYRWNLATISGTVFEDLDQHGVHDPAEDGLTGVTLDLLDPGGDGVCGTPDDVSRGITETASSGNYSFPDLAPGEYCVDVTDDHHVLQGRVLTTDNDPAGPILVGCGDEPVVDFGYSGIYKIRLTPSSPIRDVGTHHTVTASVTYRGEPLSGKPVGFTVSGVNDLTECHIRTDRNGQAILHYDYSVPVNDIGTDTIKGWIDIDDDCRHDRPQEFFNTARVTWRPIDLEVEPKCECDPTCVHAVRTFTATVESRVERTPTADATIWFCVTGGTSRPCETKTTDANGKAVFTYISVSPPPNAARAHAEDDQDKVRIWVDLNHNNEFDDDTNGEPWWMEEFVTAITLASFTAETGVGATVRLDWQTAVEIDSAGFNMHRAASPNGPYRRVNPALIPAVGMGAGASYSYVDAPPGPGAFFYKLEEVDVNGVSTFYGPVSVDVPSTWHWLYLPAVRR